MSKLVRENLTDRALRFNLVLDDVSITHVAFSPEFTHAVEAKQVAQQTALRAAFLVDQAVQEKQVRIFPFIFTSICPSDVRSLLFYLVDHRSRGRRGKICRAHRDVDATKQRFLGTAPS